MPFYLVAQLMEYDVRSLLVSHWYVGNQATVSLITKAFATLRRDPKIGRAGALREAMLALIEDRERTWHPVYLVPFVVVGEGASSPKIRWFQSPMHASVS